MSKEDIAEKIMQWLQEGVREIKHSSMRGLSFLLKMISGALSIIAIFIFLYQCYFWLRYGWWLEIPLWKAFDYININIFYKLTNWTDWKGIENIVVWFLWKSSALMSIIIGLVIGLVWLIWFSSYDEDE